MSCDLSVRLKSLRRRHGYSLTDLVDLAEVSRGHLWDLESRPSSNPTLNVLLKLGEVYNLSVSELIGEACGEAISPLQRAIESLPLREQALVRELVSILVKRRELHENTEDAETGSLPSSVS